MITVLKSKISPATVTNVNLYYCGSISIDSDIMAAADLVPYEKVDILNINNGERFSTYTIPAKSGVIEINGAAARLAMVGDKVIIISYRLVKLPSLVVTIKLDSNNKIISKDGYCISESWQSLA